MDQCFNQEDLVNMETSEYQSSKECPATFL
jgi:hypothetical protein